MQKVVSIALVVEGGGGEAEAKGISKALRGLCVVSKGQSNGENLRSPSMYLLY